MAFDKIKQGFEQAKDKVGDAVSGNRDKIDDGIDKAGDFVKDKTGNKHDDKIEGVEDKIRGGLDSLEGDDKGDTTPPAAEKPADPPA